MKSKSWRWFGLLLFGLIGTSAAQVTVNVPTVTPRAIVVLPTGASAVTYGPGGVFQLVGIAADQVSQVTVYYPVGAAAFIQAEAVDGGVLAGPISTPTEITFSDPPPLLPQTPSVSGAPGVDGAFTFFFFAGHQPGLYQVSLRANRQTIGLQFWVINSSPGARNPQYITPTAGGVQ